MKSLRVAWVIYGSIDQVTGGYIYDRLVVEQLRELGDSVDVISISPGQRELPALGRDRYDAVVADELCFHELPALFELAPELRRVLLIHHLTAWEHEPGPERDATLQLERAAMAGASSCVATSFVTSDRLESEGLVRRVSVAEPGADRMPRSATGGQEPSGQRIRLLFIGNILPRKRVRRLVEAFARLDASHVELVLAGAELEPKYAAEVRALVQTLGIGERVKFLGSIPAASLAEQLSLADALVLPSALEGYGMVLSEALWASVPVIAARVGAAEQLIGMTSAGILYEPDEPYGLDAALGAFVADSGLRRRLRHAAWNAGDILPRWRDTALKLRTALT
jgi:glycosyltransferase involved in cell wall biosynthesis